MGFIRNIYESLKQRLEEPRRFIQVLSGPRQVGKTTLAREVMDHLTCPTHFASADEPTLKGQGWIEGQWEIARAMVSQQRAALFLDEVQKIVGWSETIKRLWDEDTAQKRPLHVVILGSAPLLIQTGLTESLAGRFEILRLMHWSYSEMHTAFGWDLDHFIFFGGYPGSAPLIEDEGRWERYILDSLIETTISRDILLLTRVDKPALLRQLFRLGCDYSGQILSYQKMLGQLQDAGNTTTLAHYLELLQGAGMVAGLQKYSGQKVRQRGSSPKLHVFNTALMAVHSHLKFREVTKNPDIWGRFVESAVGAHLINGIVGTKAEIFYWREGNEEVDFVLRKGKILAAVEVKSGRKRESLSGLGKFSDRFGPSKKLPVGKGGMPLEEFFKTSVSQWLES